MQRMQPKPTPGGKQVGGTGAEQKPSSPSSGGGSGKRRCDI